MTRILAVLAELSRTDGSVGGGAFVVGRKLHQQFVVVLRLHLASGGEVDLRVGQRGRVHQGLVDMKRRLRGTRHFLVHCWITVTVFKCVYYQIESQQLLFYHCKYNTQSVSLLRFSCVCFFEPRRSE